MSSGNVLRAASGGLRERWGIAAFAVGLVLVAGISASGVFAGCQRVQAQQTTPASAFVVMGAKASPSPSPSAKNTKEIVVYVTGAVKRPGVYTLPPNARLYHAIRAAGGFKANAETGYINLADFALDGDHLAVPVRKVEVKAVPPSPSILVSRPVIVHKGEPSAPVGPVVVSISKDTLPKTGRVLGEPQPILAEPTQPALQPVAQPIGEMPEAPSDLTPNDGPPEPIGQGTTSVIAKGETRPRRTAAPRAAKFKNPGDGIVHLNSATAEQLEQLPRCGPAMSAKILAYRMQHGGFGSVKDLLNVRGVGDKTFATWQPFLSL